MRCPPIALFASILLFGATISGATEKAPDSTGIVSRIKREPVQSTALASVGYSRRLHALEIEFRNGAIYRYLDVAPSLYRAFKNAFLSQKHPLEISLTPCETPS